MGVGPAGTGWQDTGLGSLRLEGREFEVHLGSSNKNGVRGREAGQSSRGPVQVQAHMFPSFSQGLTPRLLNFLFWVM